MKFDSVLQKLYVQRALDVLGKVIQRSINSEASDGVKEIRRKELDDVIAAKNAAAAGLVEEPVKDKK